MKKMLFVGAFLISGYVCYSFYKSALFKANYVANCLNYILYEANYDVMVR